MTPEERELLLANSLVQGLLEQASSWHCVCRFEDGELIEECDYHQRTREEAESVAERRGFLRGYLKAIEDAKQAAMKAVEHNYGYSGGVIAAEIDRLGRKASEAKTGEK